MTKSGKNRFLLALCLTALPAYADEDVDVYNLNLQDLLSIKIATSTLTEKDISNIPAPVTIFSRDEIEALGVRFLHEILEYVPGYQVTRYSNYPYEYSASSRGLTFGASSKKILFLLDGHKINDPRSGNAALLANFSLHHVERLEIIRGPGSSIYGSNAFTGVINIITRKEAKEVSIATGNEINYDIFAAYSQSLYDYQFDVQVNKVKSQGDDYQIKDVFTGEPFKTDDPFELSSLQLALSDDRSRYQLHYREIDMENFYHTARTSNLYNFSSHSALFLFTEQKIDLFEEVSSSVSIDYLKTELINGNQSSPAGAFSAISEPSSDDPLHGYGALDSYRVLTAFNNNWQINQTYEMQFGLEWQYNKESRAEGFTNFDLAAVLSRQFPVDYYPNVDYKIKVGGEQSQPFYGAYLQLQSNMGAINWIVGGRLDQYPDLDSQFTPRLGLVYLADTHWQLKLLYGEAFRAPELSELTLFSGISRSGNANLESERIKTTDFIAQYTGQTIWFSIDLFYNEFKNPIINGLVNGLNGQVNGDSEYGHGIETELVWQIAEKTRLRTTATHFTKLPKSAFKDSDTLASMQLDHRFEAFQIGISGTYRSKRQTPISLTETKELDAFWYWRSFISYNISSNVSTQLSINNLLNETFYNPSITPSLSDGIPLKGRNASVTIKWAF